MSTYDRPDICRYKNRAVFILSKYALDFFPSLLIVSNLKSGQIEYCNQDTLTLINSGSSDLVGSNISTIFSRASLILFESYLRPTVIATGRSTELQMTLVNTNNDRIPVLANIVLQETLLYWSLHTAKSRDKLYQELIEVRDSLELKTEELTLLSRLDPLTNLLNRRAASADIRDLLEQVNRKFVPASFLLMDIDFFKQINDMYGHDVGDDVITKLSTLLTSNTRTTDIVARWGGEEFLIVLYNSSYEDTHLYCQHLHEKIAKLHYLGTNTMSVSIGVTVLRNSGDSAHQNVESLIKEADNALYRAKETGRNRTVFFPATSKSSAD